MGPSNQSLAVALAFLSLTACGDPLVVVGDAPGIVRIVAGMPEVAGDSLGERATDSRLNSPVGLAADAAGVAYIADRENARILVVPSTGLIDVLIDHSDRTVEPRLREPNGLALDGRGGLLVADSKGDRVWRVDLATGDAMPIAGSGTRGTSADTVVALQADLSIPTGIAVTADGSVYFSEFTGHRVRRIDPDGMLITFAGDGLAGSGGDGRLATGARVRRPAGLAVSNGVLYIADSGNHAVRAVDLETSIIESIAGRGFAGFSGDGELATTALLDTPLALALSHDGRTLFIADSDNNRIRAVNLQTSTISSFAGTGDASFNGDLRAAGETALSDPRGITVSDFDFLYIADTGHHTVLRTAVRFVTLP